MKLDRSAITFSDILYEKEDAIAWITINRPDSLNSLTRHTVEELTIAFTDAAEDAEVGVIILTGAGSKSFCSGGNMQAISERTSHVKRNHLRAMSHLAIAIRTAGKPTIAAVNGYSIGLGHELHLICDITIAAEHARFGQTGPKMGSVPVWAATQLLHRTVGEKRAREILYFCRQYSAQQALDWGLVNAVVPAAELTATATAWANELLEKSPTSLRIAKIALNAESDQAFWGTMFSGGELLAQHVDSEEFTEGPAAWLSKRKPEFYRFRNAAKKN
ncbi:MAG: enoyl-CoA hydratase-related protein [Hyphomicrobium sp.]